MAQQTISTQPAPSMSQAVVNTSPIQKITLFCLVFLSLGFIGGFFTSSLLDPSVREQTVLVQSEEPKENLNLIQRDMVVITPSVRERLDYYSLYFGFGASSSTDDKLNEIDTIVFNDGDGNELGKVSSKNFSLSINDEMEDLSLILPVAVGDYLKDNKDHVLEFVFLSKGKVYGKWSDTFSAGYSVTLDTGYCGTKGEKAMCVNTILHPEKCTLFSETSGKKIADLKPEKISNPKVDMTLVPENEIVYVECYVWYGGSIKSNTLDTSTLQASLQE